MLAFARAVGAVRAVRAQPPRRLLLALEVPVALALARAATTALPFRWVIRLAGLHEGAASAADDEHDEHARRVTWAISAVAGRMPWPNRCLTQALAAATMLRIRRIPITLYLGVSPTGATEFGAHAWLRCGAVIVTGADEQAHFRELAHFGPRPD